jgi:hypothetical protein
MTREDLRFEDDFSRFKPGASDMNYSRSREKW